MIMKYIVFLFTLFIYSQNSKLKFEPKQIDGIASFQFKKAFYYDYQINSKQNDSIYKNIITLNTVEGKLTNYHKSFLISNSNENINEIIIFSKLIIEYNQNEFCALKYALRSNNKTEYKFFIFKKENTEWIEYDEKSNLVINKIKLVLSLNNKAFTQFEVKENNIKYPEINKLKKEIRDADGTINLNKLAAVIEQNKAYLDKYIDK